MVMSDIEGKAVQGSSERAMAAREFQSRKPGTLQKSESKKSS